jgi:Flp pilus assembly protein TadG
MSNGNRDRGAAAVEFALVLPILLLLVFGIIQFGHAYQVQTSLSGAAREGAREMAIHNVETTATSVVISAAGPALPLQSTDIKIRTLTPDGASTATTTCLSPAGSPQRTVRVTASADVRVLGQLIRLTGKGQMRCSG